MYKGQEKCGQLFHLENRE